MTSLAAFIEHTRLAADTTASDVRRLCAEAVEHRLLAVCVPSCFVALARSVLDGTGVRLVSVAGFPLGNASSEVKAAEARQAVADGADEIDVVAHLGALRSGDDEAYTRDLATVVAAAGVPVKAILETAALGAPDVVRAARLARTAGVAMVKTSTGFGPGGATVEAVRLLRETVGDSMGVKASGGIRDAAFARALIDAGATRIGTSVGPALVCTPG